MKGLSVNVELHKWDCFSIVKYFFHLSDPNPWLYVVHSVGKPGRAFYKGAIDGKTPKTAPKSRRAGSQAFVEGAGASKPIINGSQEPFFLEGAGSQEPVEKGTGSPTLIVKCVCAGKFCILHKYHI